MATLIISQNRKPKAWPILAKICEGLGIDAEYAYVIADNASALNEYLKAEYDEYLLNLQNATLEQTAQFFIRKLSDLDNYCNPEKVGDEVKRQRMLEKLETQHLTYEKAKLYCDKYVTAAAKQKADDICETLRSAFAKRIDNSPWMSDATKVNALKKLNAMVFNIGSPDQWITEALPEISQKTTIIEEITIFYHPFTPSYDKYGGVKMSVAEKRQLSYRLQAKNCRIVVNSLKSS